jgi:DNA polymerase-1
MATAVPGKVRLYDRVDMAEQVARTFRQRPDEEVYFDIETTGLDPRTDKLIMAQLKQGDRATVILDLRRDSEVFRALAPIFEDSPLRIVGHNLDFELRWLRQYGVQWSPRLGGIPITVYDTMVAEQVILGLGKSEAKKLGKGVNLEDTAARYGIEVSKQERNWFIGLDKRPDEWDAAFPQEQIDYGAQDVEVLGKIRADQRKAIKKLGLSEVIKLEMRCLPAIAEMEHAGIHIEVDQWRAFIGEKEAEAAVLEDEVLADLGAAIIEDRLERYDRELRVYEAYREAVKDAEYAARIEYELGDTDLPWGAFKTEWMHKWRAEHEAIAKPKLDLSPPNLDSPAQLIAAFERLGVPIPTKKNAKKERVKTVDSAALETMDHPSAARLRTYRKAKKFAISFGENLLTKRDARDRIHSEYNQIGAGTGRFSCENPNSQQMPSKGADGKRFRKLFTAAPGYMLLTADFSNIELRILANITQDPDLCGAFEAGLDLHSETAKKMFGLPADWDKKKCDTTEWKNGWSYRDISKKINFLLIYGGSPFKLAKELGIEAKEAEHLVELFFAVYPGVKRWMRETRQEVHQVHAAKTLSGRRRPIPDVGPEPAKPRDYRNRKAWGEYNEALDEWKQKRSRAERQALNTPIQGTSADITKLALAYFFESCDTELGRLVITVHDEIVVEAREDSTGVVAELLADCMKDACDKYLTVSPVPVSAKDVSIERYWKKE